MQNKLLKELDFDFIRSPGPGGQNVNKTSTAVQLRFNIPASSVLTLGLKERLQIIAKSHIDQAGILLITAHRFRSQERNREDAIQRFEAILEKARLPARKRVATRPTLSSKITRLEQKRKRGTTKQNRRKSISYLD